MQLRNGQTTEPVEEGQSSHAAQQAGSSAPARQSRHTSIEGKCAVGWPRLAPAILVDDSMQSEKRAKQLNAGRERMARWLENKNHEKKRLRHLAPYYYIRCDISYPDAVYPYNEDTDFDFELSDGSEADDEYDALAKAESEEEHRLEYRDNFGSDRMRKVALALLQWQRQIEAYAAGRAARAKSRVNRVINVSSSAQIARDADVADDVGSINTDQPANDDVPDIAVISQNQRDQEEGVEDTQQETDQLSSNNDASDAYEPSDASGASRPLRSNRQPRLFFSSPSSSDKQERPSDGEQSSDHECISDIELDSTISLEQSLEAEPDEEDVIQESDNNQSDWAGIQLSMEANSQENQISREASLHSGDIFSSGSAHHNDNAGLLDAGEEDHVIFVHDRQLLPSRPLTPLMPILEPANLRKYLQSRNRDELQALLHNIHNQLDSMDNEVQWSTGHCTLLPTLFSRPDDPQSTIVNEDDIQLVKFLTSRPAAHEHSPNFSFINSTSQDVAGQMCTGLCEGKACLIRNMIRPPKDFEFTTECLWNEYALPADMPVDIHNVHKCCASWAEPYEHGLLHDIIDSADDTRDIKFVLACNLSTHSLPQGLENLDDGLVQGWGMTAAAYPTVKQWVHPDNWLNRGWVLLHQAGVVTYAHQDSDKNCTWIIPHSGVKFYLYTGSR
ncbi:uncharacterized protein LAESUDRAFT_762220 [Laetiporus sulphureus 93-53]|uniref:JmjC domain-containing protein n=1 Tax=Laetiporus sulphureus 93-53 TaxID=1314785 RepID=A0A165CQK7_9APHY|nr:uncharacterized protein LAESUDRAFT_762220 [Laetiporus sulphureus 93-53]KZT03242.1 hypothetical protein LAESUDRAFT_762220 [Laetiporus sulphureus 93-53]